GHRVAEAQPEIVPSLGDDVRDAPPVPLEGHGLTHRCRHLAVAARRTTRGLMLPPGVEFGSRPSRVATDRIDGIADPQSLQDVTRRWIHTVGLDSPGVGPESGDERSQPTDWPRGTDDAPSSRDRPMPARGALARFGIGRDRMSCDGSHLERAGFPRENALRGRGIIAAPSEGGRSNRDLEQNGDLLTMSDSTPQSRRAFAHASVGAALATLGACRIDSEIVHAADAPPTTKNRIRIGTRISPAWLRSPNDGDLGFL